MRRLNVFFLSVLVSCFSFSTLADEAMGMMDDSALEGNHIEATIDNTSQEETEEEQKNDCESLKKDSTSCVSKCEAEWAICYQYATGEKIAGQLGSLYEKQPTTKECKANRDACLKKCKIIQNEYLKCIGATGCQLSCETATGSYSVWANIGNSCSNGETCKDKYSDIKQGDRCYKTKPSRLLSGFCESSSFDPEEFLN